MNAVSVKLDRVNLSAVNRVGVLKMRVVTTFYRRLMVFERPLVSGSVLPNLALPVEFRCLSKSEVSSYHLFRPDQSVALPALVVSR